MTSYTETTVLSASDQAAFPATLDSKSIKTADHTLINYFADAGPIQYDTKNTSIHPEAGKHINAVKLALTDIRHNFEDFDLDTHGFQILHRPDVLPRNQEQNADGSPWYANPPNVYAQYYPNITSLLKSTLGIKSALWMDYLLRSGTADQYADSGAFVKAVRGPITRPHVDWSSKGTRAMLRNILPTFYSDTDRKKFMSDAEILEFFTQRAKVIEAEDRCAAAMGVSIEDWDGSNYDGPRWAMIDVWQPLETVRRDPLAFMDRRTFVAERDAVGVPRWYKLYTGFTKGYDAENWVLRAPPSSGVEAEHKWYWMSGISPDEVTLIKIFDSEGLKDGSTVGSGTPHTAVTIDGTEIEAPRKSIEVKGWVFW